MGHVSGGLQGKSRLTVLGKKPAEPSLLTMPTTTVESIVLGIDASPPLQMGERNPELAVCHTDEQKPEEIMTELFPAVAPLLKQELQGGPQRLYFVLLYEARDQAW